MGGEIEGVPDVADKWGVNEIHYLDRNGMDRHHSWRSRLETRDSRLLFLRLRLLQ